MPYVITLIAMYNNTLVNWYVIEPVFIDDQARNLNTEIAKAKRFDSVEEAEKYYNKIGAPTRFYSIITIPTEDNFVFI